MLVSRPENPVVDTAVSAMWTNEIKTVARDGDWILTRSYYAVADAIAKIAPGEDLSHASIYDAVSALIPFEAHLRDKAVDALGTIEGGSVLDIGCGTGLSLPRLAKVSRRVVGVDTSPRSLQIAARRAQKVGLVFDACPADAATAPWGSERFAGALSIFGMSVIGAWEETVARVYASLLPGACLVVLEQRYPTTGLVRAFNPVARVLNIALGADPSRDFARAMTEVGFDAYTTHLLNGFYALHVGKR